MPDTRARRRETLLDVPYLSGLRLRGRRVVVVGGGSVAQRRLPTLLQAGADIVLVSPEVTPAVEAMITAGELEWVPRGYLRGDLTAAWYVLAATSDGPTNAAVAAEAEAARIFCVRADAPDGGTAVTPATGQQAGVRVGVVSSGPGPSGRDPRRAAAVRDGILQALREGRLDTTVRRGSDGPGGGGGEGAGGVVGGVALVGGGPGDPELITVWGRRLLAHADVVVADRLGPRAILDELGPHVEVIDAAKLPRGRGMAQEAINDYLVRRAREGKFVVRLKGGDPFVFGRGWEEVQACAAAGVPVTVVPGVTSAVAVPGMAGIPLTHRGIAHEAVIVSGHVPPGDPRSLVDWPALARLRGTLVILMGMEHLSVVAGVLLEHGRGPDTPVAVIQDGTLPAQRLVTTTLAEVCRVVAEQGLGPPAVIVVGEVVRQVHAVARQGGKEARQGDVVGRRGEAVAPGDGVGPGAEARQPPVGTAPRDDDPEA